MGPCKSPVSCTPNTFSVSLDVIFFCSSLYVYSKAHQLIILHCIGLKFVQNIPRHPEDTLKHGFILQFVAEYLPKSNS